MLYICIYGKGEASKPITTTATTTMGNNNKKTKKKQTMTTQTKTLTKIRARLGDWAHSTHTLTHTLTWGSPACMCVCEHSEWRASDL